MWPGSMPTVPRKSRLSLRYGFVVDFPYARTAESKSEAILGGVGRNVPFMRELLLRKYEAVLDAAGRALWLIPVL